MTHKTTNKPTVKTLNNHQVHFSNSHHRIQEQSLNFVKKIKFLPHQKVTSIKKHFPSKIWPFFPPNGHKIINGNPTPPGIIRDKVARDIAEDRGHKELRHPFDLCQTNPDDVVVMGGCGWPRAHQRGPHIDRHFYDFGSKVSNSTLFLYRNVTEIRTEWFLK